MLKGMLPDYNIFHICPISVISIILAGKTEHRAKDNSNLGKYGDRSLKQEVPEKAWEVILCYPE